MSIERRRGSRRISATSDELVSAPTARRTLKGVPHAIYTLADPRTDHVRYVGRTAIKPGRRQQQHLTLSLKNGGSQPVHRWIRRLKTLGLEPQFAIVETDVESTNETLLCEQLVKQGARLLNERPGAPRLKGPIVVDIERAGEQLVADVAHLALELREEIRASDGEHAVGRARSRLRRRVASTVLREIADLLDGEPDDPRQDQRKAQRELANHFAHRVFAYADAGAVLEQRAREAELRALVVEVGDARTLREDQRKRLIRLLLQVDADAVEGAADLVRRFFNPKFRTGERTP